MLNGIINVYKEAGFTSHDVVAKMRGICGQKKIGHTGTLDPAATGVLPVCLGSGTRLCDMLTEKDKEYVAVLLLGVTTDTQDTTGTVLSRKEVNASEEEVAEAVTSFVGDYDQVPPMYSALKVNGKKLYELARAGKEVEREARRVRIEEIEILHMELPRVTMRVVCSKGTYIRTLCADIGNKLCCGGTMESLQRTRVGIFKLEEALTLSQLQEKKEDGTLPSCVKPVDACFEHLPALHVCPQHQKLLDNGNPLFADQMRERIRIGEGEQVRVYAADGRFFGIYAKEEDKSRRFKPVKMFPMQ